MPIKINNEESRSLLPSRLFEIKMISNVDMAVKKNLTWKVLLLDLNTTILNMLIAFLIHQRRI